MFTSQSLRAVVPPGALTVREQRLDDVVHQLDVRGTLDASTSASSRAASMPRWRGGVRWLIVDLADARRSRRDDRRPGQQPRASCARASGELILSGAAPDVAARISPPTRSPTAPPRRPTSTRRS